MENDVFCPIDRRITRPALHGVNRTARSSPAWAVAVLLALACDSRPPAPTRRETPLSSARAQAAWEPDDPRIVCPPESRQQHIEGDWTVTVRCLDAEGRLHGLSRRWTKAGQLVREENAIHGAMEGLTRDWSSDGQLVNEGPYRDGKLEGIGRAWHRRDRDSRTGAPQLAAEYPYHDGRVAGVVRLWHRNGRLRAVATFKGNMLVGAVRAWDENGRRVKVEYPQEYFPTAYLLQSDAQQER